MTVSNVYETARGHLLEARRKEKEGDGEGAEQAVGQARAILVEAGYDKMVEMLGSGDPVSVHRTLIALFESGEYHEDVE